MTRWSFHTPEGFVDTMPERCLAKRDLEGRLRRLFHSTAIGSRNAGHGVHGCLYLWQALPPQNSQIKPSKGGFWLPGLTEPTGCTQRP